uniref:Proteasome subunit beta n=1 Tax=Equus asinus TaxID=9793 RepID=A0A9L0K6R3_EQUAS
MAAVSVYQPPVGGFSFDNCRRNAVLEADFARKGFKLPTARKTGTTIAGVVYKDGIVLGADTRATEGMVVADKNCSKIHFISPNIYCCGAGTAADTDMTTQLISSNLELHSLSTGRLPRVVTANRMLKQMLFRYQGYIGAALVLGGVDVTGPHLYSIYPHGSTDKLPYVTMAPRYIVVYSSLWILLVVACGTPPQRGLMSSAMSAPRIQTNETLGRLQRSSRITTQPRGQPYLPHFLSWHLGSAELGTLLP